MDSRGTLLPEVREIFQIVKDHDIVLGSGHLSPREVFVLVEEAKAIGFSKMFVTHALQGQLMDAALTGNEIEQLAQSGAFIEHSFWVCMPTVARADPKQIVESVKATGAEHCIMTSDFGQYYNPPAPEGMRMFIATMLRYGLEEKEIEAMIKMSPAKLLGLPHICEDYTMWLMVLGIRHILTHCAIHMSWVGRIGLHKKPDALIPALKPSCP